MIYIFYVMCTVTIIALLTIGLSKSKSDKHLEIAKRMVSHHHKACDAISKVPHSAKREHYIELIKVSEVEMKKHFDRLEKDGIDTPKWKSVTEYV